MDKILYKVQPSIFPDDYGYLMLTADEARDFSCAEAVTQPQLDVLVSEYQWFTGSGSEDIGYNFIRDCIRNSGLQANAETFSQYLSEGSRRASYTVNAEAFEFIKGEAEKRPTGAVLGDYDTERFYTEYFEIKRNGGLFEPGPPVLKEVLFYTQARLWLLMELNERQGEIQSIEVSNVEFKTGQEWEITLSVQSKVPGIRGAIGYSCYIRPHDLSYLIWMLRPAYGTKLWTGGDLDA